MVKAPATVLVNLNRAFSQAIADDLRLLARARNKRELAQEVRRIMKLTLPRGNEKDIVNNWLSGQLPGMEGARGHGRREILEAVQTAMQAWFEADRKAGVDVGEPHDYLADFLDLPPVPGPSVSSPDQPAFPDQKPPSRRLHFNHLIQSSTQLFVGRDQEMQSILDFIQDTGSGYIFVEGPSGYGKTSLLAKLVQENPQFAYHFISQVYRISPSVFDPTSLRDTLLTLCEQLIPGYIPSGDEHLKLKFIELLTKPSESQKTIVLDGVDEVGQYPNFLYGVLQPTLPRGVVVIVSARTQGNRDYLADIGLSGKIQHTVRLTGLGHDAVVELLRSTGERGQELANDDHFTDQLFAVSEGDPFYIKFLVEDVANGILTSETINQAPTGLAGYLDMQWDQLSRSMHFDQQWELIEQIVTAPVAAWSKADLIGIIPGLTNRNFDEVLRDVRRFLLFTDGGYTFCHQRFKEHFAGKLQ